jgi:hypothetical protein
MRAVIIGGDRVHRIADTLQDAGYEHLTHLSGRKAGELKHVLPHDTQLIVLLIDQVSHAFAGKVRELAGTRGLKIIYSPLAPMQLSLKLQQIHQH